MAGKQLRRSWQAAAQTKPLGGAEGGRSVGPLGRR